MADDLLFLWVNIVPSKLISSARHNNFTRPLAQFVLPPRCPRPPPGPSSERARCHCLHTIESIRGPYNVHYRHIGRQKETYREKKQGFRHENQVRQSINQKLDRN